ncbi:MAG: hypothetical protein B7Y25_03360 [Alphaproteobacteria bacterium 16-39-46]|nr:MAG: hypothetical protein B7Y25_03360 [Alphaproteobacteria bacterium 16-39-46]OZA43375.1 MAG: hypothetical protein B7X84_03470 [Alphaproteobacteria bacterium 17-39-52]HQS83902.1 hypothetical protein [Alphaproteobacteria bacterium]HQS93832.1 hypothetical protein [Alphaproteobacteria bacterium]
MAIVKSKYILYTTLTTMALFSSFQNLEACFGDKKDDSEKRSLLHPYKETELSGNPVIIQQPQRIEVDPLFLPQAAAASLPSSEAPSLLDSFGDTTLNTSNSSAAGSMINRLGLADFEKQSEPIISYIAGKSTTTSVFQINSRENQWILTSTPDDGIEMQLILTYLTEEDSASDLLKSCLSSKLKTGRSVKDIVISPSLKSYIEDNDLDLYKRLAGIFLYAHRQAQGNIYCQKGSKGYAETLFEIKGDKIPSEYRYLYVITGPTSSSNLKTKRDAFQK